MDSDHRSYKATDLQSAPFGHSGTPPYSIGAVRAVRGGNSFRRRTSTLELADGLEPPTC